LKNERPVPVTQKSPSEALRGRFTGKNRMTMMDIKEIAALLPHRYPFLFIDRVTELVPGEYVIGYKNITFNEPQFTGHFPETPIFPGVLIIEAMAQLAGVLAARTRNAGVAADKAAVIVGVDAVRFKRPVVPGDRLVMRAELVNVKRNIWKFRAAGHVDEVLVAEAEIICTERNA
jgi:3-hydroxyacyl-[acyl-carrier-protein] dehydratase